MGRNVSGLELSADESSNLAYEWTITDLMEDEEKRLKCKFERGQITRDEYLDGIENLRETAEKEYERNCVYSEESFGIAESDWDSFQEYQEAF